MKNDGFTLLEVIIYCALFSVLMTSSIVTLYALISSSEKTTRDTTVIAEVTFINQKLDWLLYSATAVSASNVATLQISRPDLGSDSPITFSEFNSGLYLARQGDVPTRLTGPQFLISSTTVNVEGNRVQIDYRINHVPQRFVTYLQN